MLFVYKYLTGEYYCNIFIVAKTKEKNYFHLPGIDDCCVY